jgi:hypothetical protein
VRRSAGQYGYAYDIRIVNMGGKDADEMTGAEKVKALQDAKGFSWADKVLERLHRW